MKSLRKIFFFTFKALVIFLLLLACNQPSEKKLPVSTGTMAEVLVIMPGSLWNSQVGSFVKNLLQQDFKGLNASEPIFIPRHIEPQKFDGIYLTFRKILRVTIADTVKKNRILFIKDLHSHPQLLVDVYATDDTSAIESIKQFGQKIITSFQETEITRLQEVFKEHMNVKIKKQLSDQFGFYLTMQESFYIAKTSNNFAWLRFEPRDYSIGILVYTRDFKDSSQLTSDSIISYRNLMTKKHIPGQLEGSYMSTEDQFEPEVCTVKFKNIQAIEIRHLWKTVNDYMGGPFLSYTFLDSSKSTIITIEGYAYYPNHDKRELMLQIEAILKSFTLADKE
ncbi:MAG: DUF4837 family protein [Bacteroidales bacterium]|nr:DUF4837 family protein [Bacteroidales bacterium]